MIAFVNVVLLTIFATAVADVNMQVATKEATESKEISANQLSSSLGLGVYLPSFPYIKSPVHFEISWNSYQNTQAPSSSSLERKLPFQSVKELSFHCANSNPTRKFTSEEELEDIDNSWGRCIAALQDNDINLTSNGNVDVTFDLIQEKVKSDPYLKAIVGIGFGIPTIHQCLTELFTSSGKYNPEKTAKHLNALKDNFNELIGTSILRPSFEVRAGKFLRKYFHDLADVAKFNMEEFNSDFLSLVYNPARKGW